jgi:LPS O-antigen subunit length determinant protein (WzzB/FepE family)
MEDYTQVGIQASIGQLIESQLKTKMLANVRENYLLDPIDSPMLPDMKSKPYRAKIVVIGTLIGFVISLLITIILSYGFGKRDRK